MVPMPLFSECEIFSVKISHEAFGFLGPTRSPPDFFSSDRSPVMNEEQSEAGTITFLDDLR